MYTKFAVFTVILGEEILMFSICVTFSPLNELFCILTFLSQTLSIHHQLLYAFCQVLFIFYLCQYREILFTYIFKLKYSASCSIFNASPPHLENITIKMMNGQHHHRVLNSL